MSWLWLIIVAVIGVCLGVYLGFRGAMHGMNSEISKINHNAASDRNFALNILRRELANWMFRKDPDRYSLIYENCRLIVASIDSMKLADQRSMLSEICKKNPLYTDFDLLRTWDYVLYEDALNWHAYEDIEQHYTDIITFQALQAALDKNWSSPKFDGSGHFNKYLMRFKDTLFKERIKKAIDEFNLYRRDKYNDGDFHIYETPELNVRIISHFAENRYGVHLKNSNEFGIFGTFYDIDRDKTYLSFYRSNSTYSEEVPLDEL